MDINNAMSRRAVSVGFDIGGTNIKSVACLEGEILYKNTIKTADTDTNIVRDIKEEFEKIQKLYKAEKVGVGVAGGIEDGLVSADNLPFHNTPLKSMLEKALDFPVTIENDANCAVIGEVNYGVAVGCNNAVLITLGTGVGGGIVINKELYKGSTGLGGEIGHMIICVDGKACPCGLSGCLEQYASVTALVREARGQAQTNKDSMLYRIEREKGLDGRTFFEALNGGCEVARNVFDRYLDYLAAGIDSLINIFDPDAIVLAGGITKEGDKLLKPLKEKLHFNVRLEISKLQGDAGALGATIL